MNHEKVFVFRKRLLIHPQFQLTLIALNWSVITLVFGALRIQSSRIFSDLGPMAGFSGVNREFAVSYLNYQAERFNDNLLLFYLTAMVISAALTLIVSYRFAGPIMRLKSYFRALSEPQTPVTDLSFRAGDFFSDIPPVVNSAIKKVQIQDKLAQKRTLKRVS
ncbi:MAG: hypothetical protein P4M08_02230 [Oligoflexia bacterium]|nr:hypothetical protein [Oligoflexia bacterium]